jgi:hypothetical protein
MIQFNKTNYIWIACISSPIIKAITTQLLFYKREHTPKSDILLPQAIKCDELKLTNTLANLRKYVDKVSLQNSYDGLT